MTWSPHSTPAGTDGAGEFHCPRYRARCTESPTKDLEYGHKRGCTNRPEELQRWVGGDPYDPAEDPTVQNEQLLSDGGEAGD
jgi:hypothetical protein